MENQGKITIGTVCFLIDSSNNTILLLERANEPMSRMLTGVGGKTHFEEDINGSCIREIKEETGLDAQNLKLHGVIKTILDGHNSSWILFIYSTTAFSGNQIDCPEGKLHWISIDKIFDTNLIGFIRETLPYVLNNTMIEGTIRHDSKGNIIEKKIALIP